MVCVPASAPVSVIPRLSLLAALAVSIPLFAACDPGSALLADNGSDREWLVRVDQPNVGPLVFDLPPHTSGWAIHPADLYPIEGDIALMTVDCQVVSTWREGGWLVVRSDGSATLDQLPSFDARPEGNVRLRSTERCGGPLPH